MKPKVSIIIPVYNGSNYLGEAINSALTQTYENIEIIIVNDGSKDDGVTEKIAKSYGANVKYFKKENGGVSSALNLGIEKMTGEYFSWLSHDDLYYPNKIEEQIGFLNNLDDKNIIISCNYEYIDMKGMKISNSNIKSKDYNNILYSIFTKKYPIYGCGLLIPKIVFDRCGFFDESLKCTQDYDLWLKFIKKGYVFNFMDTVLSKYRKHDGQGTNEQGFLHRRCVLEESNLYSKYLFRIGFVKIFENEKKEYLKVVSPIILGYLRFCIKKIGLHSFLSPIWRKYIIIGKNND